MAGSGKSGGLSGLGGLRMVVSVEYCIFCHIYVFF